MIVIEKVDCDNKILTCFLRISSAALFIALSSFNTINRIDN